MENVTGKRIKELRQEKKLSQEQLGKAINISQDMVSLWEKGKLLPTTEHIIILAKFFNESADYILGLKDD